MKYIIPLQDTLSNIDINNSNTEVVKLNSWKYLYYLARAKYFLIMLIFQIIIIKGKMQ